MIPLGKAYLHAFVLTPALHKNSGVGSVVRYDGYSLPADLHLPHKNENTANYYVYGCGTVSTHVTTSRHNEGGTAIAEPKTAISKPQVTTILFQKERTLTTQQIEYLSNLDPELYGPAFIERLIDLQEYKNIHGNCLVPKRYPSNRTLGNWVNKTRQMFRKYQEGEKSSLTPQRIDILVEMGFQFRFGASSANVATIVDDTQSNWQHHSKIKESESNDIIYMSPNDMKWMENYQQLKDIYEKNYPSSSSSTKNDKARQHKIDDSIIEQIDSKLKQWALRQRREYQKYQRSEKSSLNTQRINLLNSIQFIWSPWEEKWNLRIEQLQEFKAKYGHCRVPVLWTTNPSLGRWVSTQRKFYKLYKSGENTSITRERIKQLSEMGFVWNHWDEKWQMDL